MGGLHCCHHSACLLRLRAGLPALQQTRIPFGGQPKLPDRLYAACAGALLCLAQLQLSLRRAPLVERLKARSPEHHLSLWGR